MTKLKHLTPNAAWQLLQDNPRAVLVDVRSDMEFLFIGHPVGAVNIPWLESPDWEVNPDFVPQVRKLMLGGVTHAMPSAPIVLICRSGKRSQEAGQCLIDAGIDNISTIDEGFEGELDENHQRGNLGGWRFHQLPWEQC